jgi:hypothetical protein
MIVLIVVWVPAQLDRIAAPLEAVGKRLSEVGR